MITGGSVPKGSERNPISEAQLSMSILVCTSLYFKNRDSYLKFLKM